MARLQQLMRGMSFANADVSAAKEQTEEEQRPHSPPDHLHYGDALVIARQLAEACHYLHKQRGIVHRDLKPENVLLMQPLPSSSTTQKKGSGGKSKVKHVK